MTTIVTRTGKGSPLTHVEVDTNFTNLNTAKLENLVAAAGPGTAAAPSISFAGDTDTGFFNASANTLGIAQGGAEAMRIDSSGRLGIGITNPDALLAFSAAVGRKINLYTGSDYSFGVEASQLRIASPFNTVIYRGGYNGSETARFDGDGRLLVGTSSANANGGILQLTSGITFPATAVASADANTLDDYEEGTWVPVVSFGGASVGITGSFSGTYTKVGNVVTICYVLGFSSKGTSTGIISISGLPFAGGLNSISGFGYIHRLGTLVPAGQLLASLSGATFTFSFAGYTGGNNTYLTDTDFHNTTDLRGGIVFRA